MQGKGTSVMADFPNCDENGKSNCLHSERASDGSTYEVWGVEAGNLTVTHIQEVKWDDPVYLAVISRYWPEEAERLREWFTKHPQGWEL